MSRFSLCILSCLLIQITSTSSLYAQEESDSLIYREIAGLNAQAVKHYDLKENGKALEYAQQAISSCRQSSVPEKLVLESYMISGKVYRDELRSYDESIRHFNKALLLCQFENQHKGITLAYNELGATFEDMGNYSVGLEYRLKALNKTKSFNADNELLHEIYRHIIDDYQMLGNKKEMLSYEKIYKQMVREIPKQGN